MLVSLKKKKGGSVQVLPPAKPHLKEMVDSLLHYPADIPRVLKAKKYLEFRIKGTGKQAAKEHAGIPGTVSERSILSTPAARILLNDLVVQEIPDTEVKDRLREMWNAKTTTREYDPDTQTYMEAEKPHWDMRKYAMDKRLALGGFNNGALPENGGAGTVVTQIKFTTINVSGVEKE